MKQVNQSLKTMKAELSTATTKAKLFGTTQDQLKTKSSGLQNTIKSQTGLLKLQQQAISKLTQDISKYKSRNSELKNSIAQTEQKLKESIKSTGENSKETKKLQNELKGLQREYNANNTAINKAENNIEKYKQKTAETEQAILKNNKALEETNKKLASQKWDEFANKLDSASNKLDNTGKKMSSLGSSMSTKVTAPILGVATACGKLSMDFEDGMGKVATIADVTKVPIGTLGKSIVKLSDDTGIASTEIANNVYDAISAGQKTGDAVNFVSDSTKLAKAGFAEAGQSLDVLTTILNSYGMKASEVTKVSDILIQTQNLGKVTVGELSSVMGKVVPTAKAYGVNLQQLSAGYAIMTAKGVKAAETTTYMNSMFNELGKSGTTANEAVKASTGQTFPQLISSGKTVGDVLNSMNGYAKKNGKSLADMFGSAEAGKAALLLSENAGKDFNNMLKEMNNSAGSTDKAFEKVNNTSGAKLKKSFNALKNAGIELGGALAPIIQKISEVIKTVADRIRQMTPAQQQMLVQFAKVAIVAGPALSTLGKLFSVTGQLGHGFSLITQGIGVATGSITGATGTVKILGTVFKGLGTAIKFVFSPTGLIIGGIILAVALIIKNWDKIKAGAKALATFLVPVWQGIANVFKTVWGGIKTFFSTIWNAITTVVKIAVMGIKFVIQTTFTLLVTIIRVPLEIIKALIMTVWNYIGGYIKTVINGIKIIITTVWNAIASVTSSIWNAIKGVIANVWNGIKAVIVPIINSIKQVITNVWNNIKAVTSSVFNAIKSVASSVWNSIKSVISSVVNGIKSVVTSVWNGIKGVTTSVWNGIKNAMVTPINAAKNTISNVINNIKGFFSNLRLRFPKIQMPRLPHFKLNGSFSLAPPSVPKLAVDWYSEGGIFTQPTIFGGIGVGDANKGFGRNAEAVLPLNDLWNRLNDNFDRLADRLEKNNSRTGDVIFKIQNFYGTKQDMENLMQEAEFIARQQRIARGGK
ncbi:phage tail tape measure protein [Clostridium sporogenes]